MADQDVRISQLPVLAFADIKDETIFTVVDEGANFQIPMSSVKQFALNALYEDRPLGEMSLTAAGAPQTFAGADFEKITAFDKIQFERGLEIDLAEDNVTLLEDGNYNMAVTINSEYASNQAVEFALLVNDVVNETLGILQGAGAGKPVYIGGGDIDPLVAGDVITLGARESVGGSVDVIFHKVRIIVARV